MPLVPTHDVEDGDPPTETTCFPWPSNLSRSTPIHAPSPSSSPTSSPPFSFFTPPLLAPLLFTNTSSDIRDHCANERTFLSYLRLSIYMAVVSVAIVLSFHLAHKPTQAELAMAKPLGIIFWVLSVATLGVGLGNYIRTVNRYGRRAAIVQTGWKTQSVMGVVSLAIMGTCVTLLVVDKLDSSSATAAWKWVVR